MNKREAIKKARKFVSKPIKCSSTSYMVMVPWDYSNPYGPTTQQNATNHRQAKLIAKSATAKIAAHLLGYNAMQVEHVGWLMYDESLTIEQALTKAEA